MDTFSLTNLWVLVTMMVFNSAIQVCHLLDNENKSMNEIIKELPNTFQTPTMAPFCKDEEKYQVVDELVKQVNAIKDNKTKIDGMEISEVLTVNGIRFLFGMGLGDLLEHHQINHHL